MPHRPGEPPQAVPHPHVHHFPDDTRTTRSHAGESIEDIRNWPGLFLVGVGLVLLALTHLSSRYFGHDVLREARAIFPETVVPRDFDVIEVPFRERGAPQLVKSGARTPREPSPAPLEVEERLQSAPS